MKDSPGFRQIVDWLGTGSLRQGKHSHGSMSPRFCVADAKINAADSVVYWSLLWTPIVTFDVAVADLHAVSCRFVYVLLAFSTEHGSRHAMTGAIISIPGWS